MSITTEFEKWENGDGDYSEDQIVLFEAWKIIVSDMSMGNAFAIADQFDVALDFISEQ